MSKICGARPDPQQRQPLVEKGGGLMQTVGLDPPGGQFDGQRHSIELAADGGDDQCFGIAEFQPRAARNRALDE